MWLWASTVSMIISQYIRLSQTLFLFIPTASFALPFHLLLICILVTILPVELRVIALITLLLLLNTTVYLLLSLVEFMLCSVVL